MLELQDQTKPLEPINKIVLHSICYCSKAFCRFIQ